MTSIISTISGYFSRSLIMGTLLPVAVFVILSMIFMVPLLPAEVPWLKPLEALDTQWKVVTISLIIVVLTGLLYNLNVPLTRLYEGYPWKEWWIGKLKRQRRARQYKSLEAQWLGLPQLQRELEKNIRTYQLTGDERIKEIQDQWMEVGLKLFGTFPDGENFLLPTRLGNVIRSFETYPKRQYGIESITAWPRLVAEIDKDYAVVVDEAKTSFDFMLNCSALSTVMALLMLLAGLLNPIPFILWSSLILWVAGIIFFGALSYFLYSLSVGRAGAWGEVVKGAFDLYRWELLKKLGYQQTPTTQEEERRLWRAISNRMMFSETRGIPLAEYSPATPFAIGDNDAILLEVGRGISAPDSSGQIMVTLQVRNVGNYSATHVVVTDKLPDGFQYKWGTAIAIDSHAEAVAPEAAPGAAPAPTIVPAARQVIVTGANPYRFTVGALRRERELLLTYHALPLKKSG